LRLFWSFSVRAGAGRTTDRQTDDCVLSAVLRMGATLNVASHGTTAIKSLKCL